MTRFGIACALITLFACSSDAGSLAVDLRTDLVPGVEFDRIEVQVGASVESAMVMSGDFLRGVRVAAFDDLSPGAQTGELRMRALSGAVISRPFQAEVRGASSVITLVVSRDCRNVDCPGDSAGLGSACLGGRCGDARCSAETPEFCVETSECETATDCPDAAGCSSALCELGACLYADSGDCEASEYCDPERGCLPRPETEADAGLDADTDAEADSGADAGVDAGTDDDFLTSCPASARPLLRHGFVAQREDRPDYTEMFEGSVEVLSFVARTYRGAGGVGVMQEDGRFEFAPGEPGEWYVPIELVTRDGVQTSCARVFVLDESAKILIRAEWNDADAYDPPGMPTADDDVITSVLNIPEDAVLPRNLYLRPLAGNIVVDAPIVNTRVMASGGLNVTLSQIDAFEIELGGEFVIPRFERGLRVLVQAPLDFKEAPSSVDDGAVIEFVGNHHVSIAEPIGAGTFLFDADAIVSVERLSGSALGFREAGAILGVTGDGPVELAFPFTNAPHVVLAARGEMRAQGAAASIDARFSESSGGILEVGSTLEAPTITLDRPVRGAGIIDAGRLILGPNADLPGSADVRADTCEGTTDAPTDICSRFGL